MKYLVLLASLIFLLGCVSQPAEKSMGEEMEEMMEDQRMVEGSMDDERMDRGMDEEMDQMMDEEMEQEMNERMDDEMMENEMPSEESRGEEMKENMMEEMLDFASLMQLNSAMECRFEQNQETVLLHVLPGATKYHAVINTPQGDCQNLEVIQSEGKLYMRCKDSGSSFDNLAQFFDKSCDWFTFQDQSEDMSYDGQSYGSSPMTDVDMYDLRNSNNKYSCTPWVVNDAVFTPQGNVCDFSELSFNNYQ